jgi:hypothetical protein
MVAVQLTRTAPASDAAVGHLSWWRASARSTVSRVAGGMRAGNGCALRSAPSALPGPLFQAANAALLC